MQYYFRPVARVVRCITQSHYVLENNSRTRASTGRLGSMVNDKINIRSAQLYQGEYSFERFPKKPLLQPGVVLSIHSRRVRLGARFARLSDFLEFRGCR